MADKNVCPTVTKWITLEWRMTTLSVNEQTLEISAPPVRPRRLGQRRIGDKIFFGATAASALVPPLLILLFVIVLAYGAWPAIKEFRWHFLVSSVWEPNPDKEEYGALPFLTGTLISSICALALATPIGIGVATFISEVVPSALRGVLRFVIEIL